MSTLLSECTCTALQNSQIHLDGTCKVIFKHAAAVVLPADWYAKCKLCNQNLLQKITVPSFTLNQFRSVHHRPLLWNHTSKVCRKNWGKPEKAATKYPAKKVGWMFDWPRMSTFVCWRTFVLQFTRGVRAYKCKATKRLVHRKPFYNQPNQ